MVNITNQTINATINQTLNKTAENITLASQILTYTKETFIPAVYSRLLDLIAAPWQHKEMLWIVTPLLITMIMMEFYFGRYTREELGWNTAVGNSLVLIFVALDLLRYMYSDLVLFVQTRSILNLPAKTFLAFFVALEGILMVVFNFFHILPKKLSFLLSSVLPINLTAYIAIVIIYTNVPFDFITIVAAVLLFIGVSIVFKLIDFFMPKKI